jgi:hypothetical protein
MATAYQRGTAETAINVAQCVSGAPRSLPLVALRQEGLAVEI